MNKPMSYVFYITNLIDNSQKPWVMYYFTHLTVRNWRLKNSYFPNKDEKRKSNTILPGSKTLVLEKQKNQDSQKINNFHALVENARWER